MHPTKWSSYIKPFIVASSMFEDENFMKEKRPDGRHRLQIVEMNLENSSLIAAPSLTNFAHLSVATFFF